jgi:hypothetical protein
MSVTDARFGIWMQDLRALAPGLGLSERALANTDAWRYYFDDGCSPESSALHRREDAPYYPPRVGVGAEGIE